MPGNPPTKTQAQVLADKFHYTTRELTRIDNDIQKLDARVANLDPAAFAEYVRLTT